VATSKVTDALPHSLETEWSLISTLVRYPRRWYDVGWLAPERLFDNRNALLFGAIGEIVSSDGSVTWEAIKSLLEQRGDWGRVGDQHLVHVMRHGAINEPLLERAAETIFDLSVTRSLILLGHEVAAEGAGPMEDRQEWYKAVVARFEDVTRGASKATGASAKEILGDLFQSWLNPETTAWTISTGLPVLDSLFRRMRPGQLIVIGAHSGLGKSALAANIADHVTTEEACEGLACGVYIQSAEMTKEEYAERLVFSKASVDTRKLDKERRHLMTEDEWRRVVEAARKLGIDRLYVDDRPSATIAQIRTEARRVQLRFKQAGTPLRLVIIDYAQIVTERSKRSREEEVANVSREAKQLAKELGVVVMLMSQLNKESTKEKRRPRASDTRESAAIENDADKLVLIYNPSYHARASSYKTGESEAVMKEFVELIVAKNRGAPMGTVPATFWPAYTKFQAFDGTPEDLEELSASGERK
jgi:replicative DNA helicase